MFWKLLWRLSSALRQRSATGELSIGRRKAAEDRRTPRRWRGTQRLLSIGLILLSSCLTQATLGQTPQIIIQPQDQSVLTGSNAVFSVTATGAPPLTYLWRFNGNDISGATSNVLTLANVSL